MPESPYAGLNPFSIKKETRRSSSAAITNAI